MAHVRRQHVHCTVLHLRCLHSAMAGAVAARLAHADGRHIVAAGAGHRDAMGDSRVGSLAGVAGQNRTGHRHHEAIRAHQWTPHRAAGVPGLPQ